MKKLFYTLSILSVAAVIAGIIKYPRLRDVVYFLAMLFMFSALASGIAYIIRKLDK
jgi:hypothetical protein